MLHGNLHETQSLVGRFRAWIGVPISRAMCPATVLTFPRTGSAPVRATLLGTLAGETAQQRRPQPKGAAASDEVPGQRRQEVSLPDTHQPRARPISVRAAKPVPPEGVKPWGALSFQAGPAMSKCAHACPSGTKACRNSPATSMPPICSPMFF